ncbi:MULTISPECIES: flagellin [unclassified Roseovarius]|uniref:flagellin n=1 Tax=unclassified Roseovarius TaxID=2614913 RepID=UPI00273F0517|nr:MULTISPECIES: flagellin [unclassified Roseovarius]
MNLQSIGDLAQTFKLRQQNVFLKQQMARLTDELASGRTANLTQQLAGSFGHIADIEHDLVVLQSYQASAKDAATSTAAMQAALDTVQSLAGDLGQTASIAGVTTGPAIVDSVAVQGRGTLETVISAFNTGVGGRALFSGTEIETAPLASADTLLNEVRLALAGALTASDVIADLDTFFDTPGGGFETLIYQGGTAFLSPYQLGEGESVKLELRADDTAVRNVLKNTVMAALADDATLPLNSGDRVELAKQSGIRLLTSQDELVGIRSSLGFAESRIEQAAARISSETSSLEMARTNLLSIDKFQTATELEQVQIQLETLYTITARASRFSLVNFLS